MHLSTRLPARNRELDIPLCRASLLKPFMMFLRELGAPVAREILKADLPRWGFEDHDVVVPTRALTAFVANAGRAQGIDNIGLRIGHRIGIRGLGPGLHGAIRSAPTLYGGLQQLCDGARRQSTRVRVWLEEEQDTLYLRHRGSFPVAAKGQFEMSWWCVGVFVSVVRVFLGEDWSPARIGVPKHSDTGSLPGELFPNTDLVALEPEREMSTWIAIPRDGQTAMPVDHDHALPTENVELDGIDALRLFIRAYLPGGPPPIGSAAEAVGMSRRTFQRSLAHNGTTYSRLVDGVRFELARDLLRDQSLRARDVAAEVGYKDPAHFTRAFQRFLGVTPREYRRRRNQALSFKPLTASRRHSDTRGAPGPSTSEKRS